MRTFSTQGFAATSTRRRSAYRLGFWAVAATFTIALGFTTVPTPLWSLYARRDGLSPLMVTVTFSAYAVGVAASLFLAGHLSDWFGRRRLLAPALALNLVAAAIFLLWPELAGLLVARALTGLAIGAVNPAAIAWLVELHAGYRGAGARRRAEVIATTVNLGGLGLGALIAGSLAQWAGDPLIVPFLAFGAALIIALVLVLRAPETQPAAVPRPRYRPQRVSVPVESRERFFAAAIAAAITFALFGLLTSLAPSFLAGPLHEPSRALAGAISFSVFAAAALAQRLSGAREPRELLAAATPAMLFGLALLTLSVWLTRPSLGVFVGGVLVAGIGAGLMFKGAIATVSTLAPDSARAEALAGLFLAAYLGLAGPVIGLGVLTQLLSARLSLLVFAALLAGGVLLAMPRLLRHNAGAPPSHRTSRSPRTPPPRSHTAGRAGRSSTRPVSD